MITMDNIIREGHPTLRRSADPVTFPLSAEDRNIAAEMMEFLSNSQDEKIAEQLNLRAGVGLAAPQIDVSKRIVALLIPGEYEDDPPELAKIMFNPKIISHSVESACLKGGEGCLSVDREVPGFVVRHSRITVAYQDAEGATHKARYKGYAAIVVQHEIDHLNGVMFYDHINEQAPFAVADDVIIIE